jgi:glycosyltransferase involved in cell wall biosynthesis
MNICAVIPTYNNESTIARVVEGTRNHIEEVLVIDDGSTDKTGQIAKDSGAHVIRVPENRGKGNSLRISFLYAIKSDFDAIITLDADLQHDPDEIPKFINHYTAHRPSIVIGSRVRGERKIPRIRYGPIMIGSYTFSWLIGQPVEDSQCGYRIYDRMVMENIPILNSGFETEADILLRAGKRGYKIDCIPIKTIYFSDSQRRSYFRPVKDTFRISIIFLMNLFWKNR